MKKYKIYWSIFNYNQSVQQPIVELQNKAKALFAIVGTGAYFTDGSDTALIVGAVSFAVDFIIGCIFLEEKNI